jgi:hypothetical protein
MGLAFMEVHLPNNSAMPKDVVLNGFVMGGVGHLPADIVTACSGPIQDFYNGSAGIAAYLSSSIDRTANACSVVSYVLDPNVATVDPVTPMGGPIKTDLFTLGAPLGAAALPQEVAMCLSYNASLTGLGAAEGGTGKHHKGGTHPAGRARGRLYLGPLMTGVVEAGPNGPMIAPGVRTIVTGAAKILADAVSAALEGLAWYVWSRVGHAVAPIIGGFMDDAFDTVRKRGIAATTRTLWTV